MKYIFKPNELVGEYPVKDFQIAWYENGGCFDEDFIRPEDFDYSHLAYVETDEEKKSTSIHSRVFANMKNGEQYEITLKKVEEKT